MDFCKGVHELEFINQKECIMEYEEMIAIYKGMDENGRENLDMIIRDECPKNIYELIDLWKIVLDDLHAEEQG